MSLISNSTTCVVNGTKAINSSSAVNGTGNGTVCDDKDSTSSSGRRFNGLVITDMRIWILFICIGVLGMAGNALVAFVLFRFTSCCRHICPRLARWCNLRQVRFHTFVLFLFYVVKYSSYTLSLRRISCQSLVLFRFTNMRRKLCNIYIINQSLIDFVASVFLVATTVFQYDGSTPLPTGFAGQLFCKLWLAKVIILI
jgi:hypothetical protein